MVYHSDGFISIECTRQKVNPKRNFGHWVIMMCQCRSNRDIKKKNVPFRRVTLVMGENMHVRSTGADVCEICTLLSILL